MATPIDFTRAQVLITGGGQGIGLALAKRFLAVGSRVLVTGRHESKLEQARRAHRGLEIFVNNISSAAGRIELATHVAEAMPGLNVLINNAGYQRRVSLAADDAPWSDSQAEIDTLLSGPIHLTRLLVPLLLAHGGAGMIVNVTSGGAYFPQPFAPVYSACKAALHSFTVNLRFAMSKTAYRVVELIPPAVQTGLGGTDAGHGAPLDEFADSVFKQLSVGERDEIGFGPTASPRFEQAAAPYREMFQEFQTRTPVKLYGD
ncbi:SDR family NAD(P)-dependent oxidoreductase [Burkholderia glumae]|uniref:SDR family NAD(P)-dependent oxidoreductase n=1 Tax=Burkholderia glumae TaxID=337 RepID=A0AAP9XWJ2_BURGL|nr:SDR family NAD(P)-dependent oxidoreductase [Burkholderia glumae]AJY63280.1 short chain dehydrogenase family protein [Burkholderia glumae LMG 2196 = ATCC 33617]KHJ61581.1 D-alanyl-lipoteichoic acid biosynthesis protein [Burkholderia glumae]MCM2483568.1 SDR family NAD(P)-dependent oxidoreductase [Burkholderia glumae]MCM2493924.1 SDR family NAD(P)-dependent oxidoreductase [Burkholderia glumae]MCM2509262.1 SDR family NAD(P)-dependent oxidoreductase [Burkholderia glumae]